MNLAKLVSLGIALLLIQARSHPIEIVGQGDVTSASGNRNCYLEDFQQAKVNCTKNYAVGAYQETYYAIPRAGWQFDHWGNNYCPNATPPNYDCSFNIAAATVQQYWGQTMPPLKAVFSLIGDTDGDGLNDDVDPCPANPNNPCALMTGNDIVTAVGKEWAQPVLFISLSWSEMNDACPNDTCNDGAILNGRDMTGWNWARFGDVIALFNSYGVSPPLLTTQGVFYTQKSSVWAPAMLADGWTPTAGDIFGGTHVRGFTREYIQTYSSTQGYLAYVADYPESQSDYLSAGDVTMDVHEDGFPRGAWFYRSPP